MLLQYYTSTYHTYLYILAGRPVSDSIVLRRGLLFLFALPAVMQSFFLAPLQGLIQGIYSKHGGVELASIGFAVMLVRVWDAVIDPGIGYLSDVLYPRLGSRKPWMVVGTVITALGLWFLFQPPPGVTAWYFAGWYLFGSIGWSFIEVSYRAWSVELSRDYVQRTRIQVWMAMAAAIGGVAFYVIPVAAKGLGLSQSSEFDFQNLGLAAVVVVLLLPPLNFVALRGVPGGTMESAPTPESWSGLWRSIARNGPLLRLMVAYVVFSFGIGIGGGVYFLFLDVYLGLSQQLAGILLVSLPMTFLALPFWGWISTRYERHKVWALSIAVMAALYALNGFLPRGEAALVPAAVLFIVVAFCLLATFVVAPAMLGDIVDYGRLEFGRDRAGMYVAMYMLVLKTMQGLAGGFALVLIGWLGFDATAKEQTEAGTFAIKLAYAWLPAVLMACVVPIVWSFPLTRAAHADIVARLKEREAQA
jgi:glycoside/pentoside/hexuronide:cation symporter, GPH family